MKKYFVIRTVNTVVPQGVGNHEFRKSLDLGDPSLLFNVEDMEEKLSIVFL